MLQLLTRFETWLIIGSALVVLDLLLGMEFFALAFGIGGLVTGFLLLLLGNEGMLSNWQTVVTVFGVASVLVLFPLRRWIKKTTRENEDINHY
ncbi:MAG: hypothetical protein Cons2KO_18770 [Congregibacter sp.]